MRRCRLLVLLLSTGAASLAMAQARALEGIITDEAGAPIAGARVAAVASGLPVFSDELGHYRLTVGEQTQRVQVSAAGYGEIETFIGTVRRVDVVLPRRLGPGEVVGLGGHRPGHTAETAMSPVEVVYTAAQAELEPYGSLGQVLTHATTVITSLPQVSGTTADFVDPLGFSGGGPGQVLVLVNGHRRHRSAQLSTGEVFGRGSAGYDLAALPLAAVDRVEVLRGPATATYGTDAVAGVINVVLRRDPGLTAAGEIGGYVSGGAPPDADLADGRFGQGAIGYGRALGRRGGFARVTVAAARRDPTNRMRSSTGPLFSGYNAPGGESPTDDVTDAELARRGLTREDFRERAGQAALDRAHLVANAELPLAGTWVLYGSGDVSLRRAEATGRYARPNEARANTAIYPIGFAPVLGGVLDDQSATVGVRGGWREWEADLSNGYGRSAVELGVANTANASLGASSPTSFDAGGLAFWQNTTRLEVRRFFPEQLAGLHLAGGVGARVEDFRITAGEGGSYARLLGVTDPIGRPVPGSAQGLPGFSPEDATRDTRVGAFGYAEAELSLTSAFGIGSGIRYERYGDIGGGVSGDIRARVSLGPSVRLRGSISTGVRAPTLQEARYGATALTEDGLPFGIFPGGSTAARALGIAPLALERHVGASGGVTARLERYDVELSADGFLVDVEAAAGLTGAFGADPGRLDVSRLLSEARAGRARFAANAFVTRPVGVTASARHAGDLPYGARLRVHLAGTYARTGVEAVRASSQLAGQEAVYLSPASRSLFDAAAPRLRILATFHVDYRDFTFMARGNYFGAVEAPVDDPALAQTYGGAPVADLSVAWRPMARWALTVGASNVLDRYPDRNRGPLNDGGRAVYSRSAQQFGTNGRYLFGRLSYGLARR